MMNISIELLYFASVREVTGRASETWQCRHGSSLDELRLSLQDRYALLGPLLKHARWAVNEQFVELNHTLEANDRVAIIMPVSGGGEPGIGPPEVLVAELTFDPIDSQTLISRVQNDRCGAVCLFLGTVREFTETLQTVDLVYEAYPEMAIKQMRQILEEAATKWPIPRLGVIHRLGRLQLGEASIAVAVATPHRAASFEACQWIMDSIKKRVPVWKQEHWADGTTQWVHPGTESC